MVEDNFTVIKANVVDDVNIEFINSTYGNVSINITIPKNFTGKVNLTIDNKTQEVNIINGQAVVPVDNITGGSHTFEVTYNGDDNFEPFDKIVNLTVTKDDIDLCDVGVTVNGTYGNASVIVTVPKGVTGNITVTVGNETFSAPIVNSTAVIPLPGVGAGNHIVKIEYIDDDNYNPFNTTENITIPKAEINPNKDVDVGVNGTYGNGTIVITVPKNMTGNVTIIIGGNVTVNVPIENGTVIINLPEDLPAGNHTVVIKYPGDENYDPFNVTDINITIPKADIDPDKDVNVTMLDPSVGNATVEISVPKGMTGNITITVNGTDYNATIENGTVVYMRLLQLIQLQVLVWLTM